MHYGLVDNNKVEAEPGLKAVCPGCLQPLIAKCGTKKVHHWAHRSKIMCDSWWEPETEWHRLWKNNYPVEWQEIFLPDERTGEKHIADVRTNLGLVIEFQHSHITQQERVSREDFYKTMVWVVDGTRLKRDYPRFVKRRKEYFRQTGVQGFFFVDFPGECFPADWLQSKVPVIFDFRSIDLSTETKENVQEPLWCLYPGRDSERAIVAGISHKDFISITINEPRFLLFPKMAYEEINRIQNNLQQQQKNRQMQSLMSAAQRKEAWRRRGRRL